MLLFLPVKVFKIQIQPVANTDGCLICFYIVFSIYVFPFAQMIQIKYKKLFWHLSSLHHNMLQIH